MMEEMKMGIHHAVILILMAVALAFLGSKAGLPNKALMPAVKQPESFRPAVKSPETSATPSEAAGSEAGLSTEGAPAPNDATPAPTPEAAQ